MKDCYQVQAYDAAGNESKLSGCATWVEATPTPPEHFKGDALFIVILIVAVVVLGLALFAKK